MNSLTNAELFAKTKHGGKLNEIGVSHSNHLENVVNRLKSLGVIVRKYFVQVGYKIFWNTLTQVLMNCLKNSVEEFQH